MEKFKFLGFLASDGLSLEEAKSAVVILDDYIARLESAAAIDPFVEETSVRWERGVDGKLELTGEVTQKCMDTFQLKSLNENLEKLANARALKKWLAGAIEYKIGVTTSYNITILNSYGNIYDIYSQINVNKYMRDLLFAVLPDPPKPEKFDDEMMTADDYFVSLNADDLAKYYAAQAAASTIGDFIHPEGSYAKARVDLVDKIANPCKIDKYYGGGATILKHVPTVDINDVDKMYFFLQGLQREYQKGVNSVKYKAEDAVSVNERAYYEKLQKIEADNLAKLAEYNDAVNSLIKEINDAASKLRIAVPRQAKEFLNGVVSISENR